LQATFTVGSMAVFIDGSPASGNYRHFKIRHIEGQDDPAMMQEILARRLKYLKENEIGIEDSFYSWPDLIVVDGGKAQYNFAKKALEEEKLDSIDLISLAKREETVYCEKYPYGVNPGRSRQFMKILIRIRDEAHRFAINYHKKLRDSSMTISVLDGIKGIGEKKKSIVLSKFGTLEELKACRFEDFLNIKGLGYQDALNIYNSLNK
jgi:excinuclease ABC subunit C